MPQEQNKINICHLTHQFYPYIGGHIHYMMDLFDYFNAHFSKQFVIAPEVEDRKDISKIDKNFCYEIYRIRYYRFKWLLKIKGKLKRLSIPLEPLVCFSFGFFALKKFFVLNKKHGIDVIIAHGVGSGLAATIPGLILRKPVVWRIYGTLEAYSKFSGIYESLITKICKPNHIFAGSGTKESQKFINLVGHDKVTTINSNVNTRNFSPKQKNKDLLNQYKWENKFIILFPHSLIPFKGAEYAILAFEKFLKQTKTQNAILLILGEERGALGKRKEKSYKSQLEEIALNMGIINKVIFPGEIDYSKIPDYLNIADIILATSIYSNQNSSVREAMACGRPVIAFDSGDTHNIIHHMETGLLAESGNVDDLAKKILNLYDDAELRQIIGKNARKFSELNLSFDSRKCIELEIFKKLVKNKIKASL